MFEYNTDPLCGFTFTTSGFMNLFQLLKSAFIKEDWNPQNSSLPIFLIAGVDDPVIQGKKKFNEILGSYVYKPDGKVTLVPDSDKREAIYISTAEADFSQED